MLVVLIGPKGSGKSHIGRLLQRVFGVHHLDVETHWMAHRAESAEPDTERFIAAGIERIHPVIEASLREHASVCVDTTGASPTILEHLLSFRSAHRLLLIRVDAPVDVCLERIRRRGPANQVPMDEEGIRRVHALGRVVDPGYDLVVENVDLSDGELRAIFSPWFDVRGAPDSADSPARAPRRRKPQGD